MFIYSTDEGIHENKVKYNKDGSYHIDLPEGCYYDFNLTGDQEGLYYGYWFNGQRLIPLPGTFVMRGTNHLINNNLQVQVKWSENREDLFDCPAENVY